MFRSIAYLQSGNPRQQLAYAELMQLNIFEILKPWNPLLAGTIPIEIDIPSSDLDILCECSDQEAFQDELKEAFGTQQNFELYTKSIRELPCTICRFSGSHFEIEVFGQDTPSHRQYGFRHMLIEHQILLEKGPEFRQGIIDLKKSGYKTEPAFAKLLGLDGDPYEALLQFEKQ